MPYSVEHLIEKPGNVVVIQKTETVTAVLDLMIAHDFSQLPVVDEKGALQGMVTHESILRALRSFNTKLDQLCVRDALAHVPSHYREDDLFDLLDELQLTNAVAVVEPEGYVIGVVTSYDAVKFLRNRTEDLMHVEDIEFIIKELIKRIYADQRLEVSPNQPGRQTGSRNTKPFEELNLGDYINLLMSRSIWRFCGPILNIEKEALYELLVKIRQTRNDLAHFRSEISPRSRDELRYCANWLRSRYQEYEKERGADFINTLLKQHEAKEAAHGAREAPVPYAIIAEGNTRPADSKTTAPSRYGALANWLVQQKEAQVLLTFEQLEEVLASSLPASARQMRAWWANDLAGHAASIAWREAGWEVAYVDLAEKQVIFARSGREQDRQAQTG